MNKLILGFTLISILFGCDSQPAQENDDVEDTMAADDAMDTEVEIENDDVTIELNCQENTAEGNFILSVLMQEYNNSMPVDTVSSCKTVAPTESGMYDVPEGIEAVADTEKHIYYSYVDNNQVVIMRSPKGSEPMNYQVHMSIPVQAPVNTPD